jgi:hypothetical protein
MTMLKKNVSGRNQRRFSIGVLIAAAAFSIAGISVVSVTPAEAATRCVAHAYTIFGKPIRGTKASRTARRGQHACRVALNRCHRKLNRVRHFHRFNYPLARCHVTRRNKWGHGHKCKDFCIRPLH